MTLIRKILTALLIIAAGAGYLCWLAERDAAAIWLAQCGAADSRDQYAICVERMQASAFLVR
jgi:hypothetical protein